MSNMVQVPLARPPSKAEIDETRLVRALQVRTNAIQFAIAALERQAVHPTELVELAGRIEAYLNGGDGVVSDPSSVLADRPSG